MTAYAFKFFLSKYESDHPVSSQAVYRFSCEWEEELRNSYLHKQLFLSSRWTLEPSL